MTKNKKLLFLSVILIPVIAVLTYGIFLLVNNMMQPVKMYSAPKKIADYLYEINYTDYTPDEEGVTHNFTEAFGCSSVHNGNFYGRNFDFIFNDTPEFIIRVSATENRHASLGVATHYGLREVQMEEGKYDKQLELIPNLTLDGINDAGVIASINVVPGKEDVGELTGTNPEGEDLPAAQSVRFILDNASSAKEAVELLRGRNIFGTAVNNMYLHIMIADSEKTYIVEFINNKLVAEEKTGDEQIMTNFYTNLPELTEHSAGVERYQILQENYAQGDSLVGMRDLMARVKYSNAYNYATEPWYSEALPQSVIKNFGSIDTTEYMEAYDNIRKDYWNYTSNNLRNPANSAFWHTTHNSVYDIANRMLRVTVQEDYSHYYDFTL